MSKLYLEKALATLFRPVSENGFWDEKEGRIVERLYFDKNFNWYYIRTTPVRYLSFCLTSLLLAKEYFDLDTHEYDEKIISSIKYLNKNKNSLTNSDLTYGAVSTILLQEKFYGIAEIDWRDWSRLINQAIDSSLNNRDNHDALILVTAQLALKKFPFPELKEKYFKLLTRYLDSFSEMAWFETGDLRGNYHQRIMYVLWGLIFASEVFPEKQQLIGDCVKQSLDRIWKERRQQIDNAFLWHKPFYFIKSRYGFSIPVISMLHWDYLFECHQTFYSNAIHFYNRIYKMNLFESISNESLEWIFGKNRINKNLVELSGIDVPIRLMNTKGEVFIKDQNFKGIYEVGSYILALAGNQFFSQDLESKNK